MTTRKYKTDINCDSCVAAVTPYLNAERSIRQWSVNTADLNKVLTIEGDGVHSATIRRLVAGAGFQVLDEFQTAVPSATNDVDRKKSLLETYYQLLLVFAYLVGGVALLEFASGSFELMRAMAHFMGGFFLVFSFFKLLDLRAFADAYRTYDVLARKMPAYGFVYPFIELLLGAAFLAGFSPTLTNSITLGVMLLSTLGVAQTLLQKRRIRCACLGAVFNMPVSYVRLFEDVLMVLMAAVMLVHLYSA